MTFLKVQSYFSSVGQMVKFINFCLPVFSNFSLLNISFYNMKVYFIRKLLLHFFWFVNFFQRPLLIWLVFSYLLILERCEIYSSKYLFKSGWVQSLWLFPLTSWMTFRKKIFLQLLNCRIFWYKFILSLKNSQPLEQKKGEKSPIGGLYSFLDQLLCLEIAVILGFRFLNQIILFWSPVSSHEQLFGGCGPKHQDNSHHTDAGRGLDAGP